MQKSKKRRFVLLRFRRSVLRALLRGAFASVRRRPTRGIIRFLPGAESTMLHRLMTGGDSPPTTAFAGTDFKTNLEIASRMPMFTRLSRVYDERQPIGAFDARSDCGASRGSESNNSGLRFVVGFEVGEDDCRLGAYYHFVTVSSPTLFPTVVTPADESETDDVLPMCLTDAFLREREETSSLARNGDPNEFDDVPLCLTEAFLNSGDTTTHEPPKDARSSAPPWELSFRIRRRVLEPSGDETAALPHAPALLLEAVALHLHRAEGTPATWAKEGRVLSLGSNLPPPLEEMLAATSASPKCATRHIGVAFVPDAAFGSENLPAHSRVYQVVLVAKKSDVESGAHGWRALVSSGDPLFVCDTV